MFNSRRLDSLFFGVGSMSCIVDRGRVAGPNWSRDFPLASAVLPYLLVCRWGDEKRVKFFCRRGKGSKSERGLWYSKYSTLKIGKRRRSFWFFVQVVPSLAGLRSPPFLSAPFGQLSREVAVLLMRDIFW